jgi:actin-related protein 6
MPTVILDNGSSLIKLQLQSSSQDYTCAAPNCIARSKDNRKLYVGTQLWERLKQQPQTIQFKRAHDRGYLVSWEAERLIWDDLFRLSGVDDVLAVKTKGNTDESNERDIHEETTLILTEPPDNLSTLQEMTDHIVFEYYKFDAFVRIPPALLASYGPSPYLQDSANGSQRPFCLVVDVGFSYTHITPIIDGEVATAHCRRIDIGGKFLTNVLKDNISFRHYNMMEETLLVQHIKETCCFVSLDFDADMKRARQGLLKAHYLLPEVSSNTPGRRVDEEELSQLSEDAQILPLTTETFAIPELLFTPSDLNHSQGGIVDGVVQIIESLPRHVQGLLLADIIVIGQSARFKNFGARLERDLRSRVDDALEIRIDVPGLSKKPETTIRDALDGMSSWLLESAKTFANSKQCATLRVTQQEWSKHGRAVTQKRWPGLLAMAPAVSASAPLTHAALASLDSPLGAALPEMNGPGRRRSMYVEEDHSETSRSYSPTTEEEFDSDGKPKPKRIKLKDLNKRGRRRGRGGRSQRTSDRQGSSSRAVSVKSETAADGTEAEKKRKKKRSKV